MTGRAGSVLRRWDALRPLALLLLPAALGVAVVVVAAAALWSDATNRTILELKAGADRPVATSAVPEALLARIEFLLAHDRLDEIEPYAVALDRTGPDTLRAIAHYDFANGRLRQAFDLLMQDKIDPAGPYVVLARQEYRRALTLLPDDWDAKFNLDVASRLIRDFPSFERTIGDEAKTDRRKIWTDIPGKPEGLP